MWDRNWETVYVVSNDISDAFIPNVVITLKEGTLFEMKPVEESGNNKNFSGNWITDKSRLFVESIYSTRDSSVNNQDDWDLTFKKIINNFYNKDFISKISSKKNFFILSFDNISLEVLNLLNLIEQSYSFIKLRRIENYQKTNIDNELDFQLNKVTQKSDLLSSTLCLLIGTNPRYEGSTLNLNLRQRYLKGNFKIMSIGSMINLTIPVQFLGSSIKTIKSIIEGNNLFCSDLISSKNPLLVYNNELKKRNDLNSIVSMFQLLKHSNFIDKKWNGLNILNSAAGDTGIDTLNSFESLKLYDFKDFNGIYIINNQVPNSINIFEKISELKLLNTNWVKHVSNKFTASHKVNFNNNSNKNLFFNLPNKILFEDNETFINTEGSIKRIPKLINSSNTSKSNWQILRKFFMNFKNLNFVTDKKLNNNLNFNCNNLFNFRNYLNFQYYATQNLTNLNFFLKTTNKPLNKLFSPFKTPTSKIFNTKIKYWLDEFFSGGKDGYTQNSINIHNCSKLNRLEKSNFF